LRERRSRSGHESARGGRAPLEGADGRIHLWRGAREEDRLTPRAGRVTLARSMPAVPPRQELRLRPLETSRLILSPVDTSDARDLWAAVEASRTHLEPWLPWVPFNTDAE